MKYQQQSVLIGILSIILMSSAAYAAQIHGIVQLRDGKPVANSTIESHTPDWSATAGAASDTTGKFTLEISEIGTWTVYAYSPEGYESYDQSQEVSIEIGSLEDNINLNETLILTLKNLQGKVTLADGSSVTDAEVYAYTENWAKSKSIKTEEDGTFKLVLDEDTWFVYADPPENLIDNYVSSYQITQEIISRDQIVNLDPMVLRLKNVQGTVTLPDGNSVADAVVYAYTEGWVKQENTTSNTTGQFKLPLDQGQWEIYAVPPENLLSTYISSSLTELYVETSDQTITLDTPLKLRSLNVKGKVTLPDGQSVVNAYIYARIEDGTDSREVYVDDNGEFHIFLSAGIWLLTAFPPEDGNYQTYCASDYRTVEIKDLNTLITLENPLVFKSKNVFGQVLLIDTSQPVPNAGIQAYTKDYQKAADTRADDAGNFGLSLEPGEWLIYADAPYGEEYEKYSGSEPVEINISSEDLSITLDNPLKLRLLGQISGKVTLPDGSIVPNASVYAASEKYDMTVESNESGEFLLKDLVDGIWQIRADPPSGNAYHQYCQSDSISIEISKDNQKITLTEALVLKKGTKHISGYVKDPNGAGAKNVEIRAVNWKKYEFKFISTDASGFFEFYVGDGEWEIEALQNTNVAWISPEPQKLKFEDNENPEEKSLTIQLPLPDAYLNGRVVEPSGKSLSVTQGEVNEWAGIEIINTVSGFYRWVPLKSDGSFSFPLLSGTYEISMWLDPRKYPDFAKPAYFTFTLDKGMKKDLGDIYLLFRTASIQGTVRDINGKGIPGIFVGAWDAETWDNWFEVETDENGEYEIQVPPGTWIVEPWVDPSSLKLFTGDAKEVSIKDQEIKLLEAFQLENIAGVILGTVKDEDGNILAESGCLGIYPRGR